MKITISELKEGMTLAKDVTSPNGQLLLKGGAPITDKHIRAFKMWGISEFEMDGENDLPKSEFTAEILAKADNQLQFRFFGSNLSNPVLSKIYSFCLNRLALKLSRQP